MIHDNPADCVRAVGDERLYRITNGKTVLGYVAAKGIGATLLRDREQIAALLDADGTKGSDEASSF